MTKCKTNLIIDAFLLIVTAMLAGGGFLVYYVLLPGQDAKALYGHGVELQFMNLTRHQWADVHLILAFVFIALLLLHVAFHWTMIVKLTQKYCTRKGGTITLTTLLAVSTIIIILPFFISPTISTSNHHRNYRNSAINANEHHYQNHIEQKQPNDKLNKDTPKTAQKDFEKKQVRSTANHTHQAKHNDAWEDEVRGTHTLAQACKIANIPVNVLCKKLGISEHSKNERMGHIKKTLNMELNEIKDIMAEIKPTKK